MIRCPKYIQRNYQQVEVNLALGLHLAMAQPDNSSPRAFEPVPTRPVTDEDLDAVMRNYCDINMCLCKWFLPNNFFKLHSLAWNSMYLGMNVPKPMKAKTKKRLEKKLHMKSLFLTSLMMAALNPLMTF